MPNSYDVTAIDLKAAVSSRSASRALSRISNRNSSPRDFGNVGSVSQVNDITTRQAPQHDAIVGRPEFSPTPSKSSNVESNSLEAENDTRFTDQLFLGSTAAAMGAVVQVFKGRGGKATLAAWNKVPSLADSRVRFCSEFARAGGGGITADAARPSGQQSS